MNTSVKIKGIRKSVGEFNNWIGHAEVMLNTETMEVFTDCFTNADEWLEHGDNIVRLHSKGRKQMAENWNKTTVKEIIGRANYYIEHGEINY